MPDVSLSLLVLRTEQVGKLRQFYGTLGIAFVEEQHGNGPVHFAAEANGVVIEIYPLVDRNASADTTTRLGFKVENLTEIVSALNALAVDVVTTPKPTEWGVRTVVRDPDGRSVELYER